MNFLCPPRNFHQIDTTSYENISRLKRRLLPLGKNKKEKPELTLENLNRAIRTYQQLASLQNMEILQSVAKQENFLDPEIFCNQSDSSVIKNV